MKINDIPIAEKLVDLENMTTLEPIVHEKDLLIPIVNESGKCLYFKIPGKLIWQIVELNKPSKIKR